MISDLLFYIPLTHWCGIWGCVPIVHEFRRDELSNHLTTCAAASHNKRFLFWLNCMAESAYLGLLNPHSILTLFSPLAIPFHINDCTHQELLYGFTPYLSNNIVRILTYGCLKSELHMKIIMPFNMIMTKNYEMTLNFCNIISNEIINYFPYSNNKIIHA